jgi:hypothetical protein
MQFTLALRDTLQVIVVNVFEVYVPINTWQKVCTMPNHYIAFFQSDVSVWVRHSLHQLLTHLECIPSSHGAN